MSREFSQHGVISHVDQLASQMSDVDRPRVCPLCFHALAVAIGSEERRELVERLLKTHHGFWTACALLASSPGTASSLSVLRATLRTNIAACNRLHRSTESAVSDPVACLMDALCSLISRALTCGPNAKFTNTFLAKKGSWPTCVLDVLPLGIGTYLRWACVVPTRSAARLTMRLILVARVEVKRDLFESPSRDRVVAVVVRALRKWEAPLSSFPGDLRSVLRQDITLPDPPDDVKRAIITDVISIVDFIVHGPDANRDDILVLARGYERLLYDAIVDFVSYSLRGREDFRGALLRAACYLQSAHPDLELSPVVRAYRECKLVSSQNVEDIVFTHLFQASATRVCSEPHCSRFSRAVPSDRHLNLSACSGCRFARYCSRTCQRSHWSPAGGALPHKTVCSALNAIVRADVLCPGTTLQQFSTTWGLLDAGQQSALMQLSAAGDILPQDARSFLAWQFILRAPDDI